MKRKIRFTVLYLIIALIVVAFTAGGCGEAKKEAGIPADTTSVDQAANVGADNCMVCHSSLTHTVLSGVAGINPDPSGLANAITHDCEACHGGGQYHFGSGPIPYPSPNGARCATCHAEATAVLASKHNAEDAANVSMIADGHDTGKCQRCHTAEGSRAFAEVIGNKAAYDVILSYGSTPGPGQFVALPNLLDMSRSTDTAYTDIRENHILHNPTCVACHNPLTKEFVSIAGWDPNGNASADQFDLCTSCHVYNLNNNGTLIGSGQTYTVSTAIGADAIWFTADDTLSAGTLTEAFYHDTSWYRTIASTHFDNPDSGTVVEGYVIRKNSANPCFDCHNHELFTNTRFAYTTDPARDATPTIFTDWAESGHAGGLLKAKYDVSRTAGVNNSGTKALVDKVMSVGANEADASWPHYNWDDRAGRGSCQVCHTATGIANFLNDPAAYDLTGAGNDYSHLTGWTPAGSSGQNELLYCWGCHSDSKGALRNPGPIPLVYTYTPTSAGGFPVTTVNVTLPEAGKSNVCVKCHGGRGNNDTILANVQDADFSLVDTVNRSTRGAEHHAPTAASLYAALTHSGYEYTGKDYTGAPTHAAIDSGATGRGPCVSCHLGSSAEAAASQKNHSFEATEHDTGGAITTIVHLAGCNTAACHNGGMSVASLQAEQDGSDAAYAVLDGLMKNTIVNYLGLDIATTSNNNYKTIAPEAYGAFMNYKYMSEDPCAYVHNNLYNRRLYFDSIDWMQDGDLDGTIDLTGYATAAAFLNGASPVNAVVRP